MSGRSVVKVEKKKMSSRCALYAHCNRVAPPATYNVLGAPHAHVLVGAGVMYIFFYVFVGLLLFLLLAPLFAAPPPHTITDFHSNKNKKTKKRRGAREGGKDARLPRGS